MSTLGHGASCTGVTHSLSVGWILGSACGMFGRAPISTPSSHAHVHALTSCGVSARCAQRAPTYQSSVSLCAGRLCWRLRLRFRAPPEPGSQPPASPPPSSVPSPAAPRARLLPPGVQLRRPLRLPPEARVCPPPLLRARPLRLGRRRLEHAHVDGRGRVGGREERVRRPLEVLERKASEKGPWCAISISRLHLGESSKSSWCASRLAALRSAAACTLPKLGRAAHSGSRASSSLRRGDAVSQSTEGRMREAMERVEKKRGV